MTQKTETQKIGDFDYTYHRLPGRRGRTVGLKLLKALAPALKGVDSGEQGEELLTKNAVKLIASAIQELDVKDVDFIADEFAKATTVAGEGVTDAQLSNILDLHFQGRVKEQFEWLIFCAKSEIGPFFG